MTSPGGFVERQPAGVVGGFLASGGARSVSEVLASMAAGVEGAATSLCLGSDPAGLFATGHGVSERTDDSWVVADLDLVNLAELHQRAGLERGSPGLLARLYALEGLAFVRRLRGAFALALWDRSRKQLLLAVDHFGMRRLHYTTSANGTAFSSRLWPLLSEPGGSKQVSPDAIYSYLNFRFIPAPEHPVRGCLPSAAWAHPPDRVRL